MDILNKLWPKSFKEWNLFYELVENNNFVKESYDNLILHIREYKKLIRNNNEIDKKIIKHLYVFMWIFIWIINDVQQWKYEILNVKDWEQLNDYYDGLYVEIMQLMSTEKED